jgi:hypothetical protein
VVFQEYGQNNNLCLAYGAKGHIVIIAARPLAPTMIFSDSSMIVHTEVVAAAPLILPIGLLRIFFVRIFEDFGTANKSKDIYSQGFWTANNYS